MSPTMGYNAVKTKVITKRGRIFKKEFFDKILECSDLDSLIDCLKNTDETKKMFDGVNFDDIHRGKLEILVNRFKTMEMETLFYYFSGEYKEFVKALLMEFEIKDLILVLRKLNSEEDFERIKPRFIHSKLFSSISFEKILSSNTIYEFVSNLKGTPYYYALRNVSLEDVRNNEFYIEMKLFLVLYNTIKSKLKLLKGKDYETAKDIIGTKVDLLNICWIYRAIKFYKISTSEMIMYSLDGGKKITYNNLKKLCNSESAEEFKKIVKNDLKYDFLDNVTDEQIDIMADKYLYNYLRRKNYDDIGSVISFIYLLDIFVNDLTTIIEGIKYKVPRQKIESYLSHNV